MGQDSMIIERMKQYMKLFLIGYAEDVVFVKKQMTQNLEMEEIFILSDLQGPYELSFEHLNKYDMVILAVKDMNLREGLLEYLRLFGLPKEKILDFYCMYEATLPFMIADRRLMYRDITDYRGIILGISHAEVGIIPRLLQVPFCNLAISSQDIFYNMKTLAYVTSQYADKFKNLEYLVIDMFDYTYFNYDASLSRDAWKYYAWGGYNKDSHNFSDNKHYDFTLDEWLFYWLEGKRKDIDENKTAIWERCFENAHQGNQYGEYAGYLDMNQRVKILDEKDVSQFKVETSIVKNYFDKTIKENLNYFEEMLKLAYQINPNIKVYIILMPVYEALRHRCEQAYQDWKKFFYDIIEIYNKKYPFTFLDLKEHELSNGKQYFYDATHLNYYGAAVFTEWFNHVMIQ